MHEGAFNPLEQLHLVSIHDGAEFGAAMAQNTGAR